MSRKMSNEYMYIGNYSKQPVSHILQEKKLSCHEIHVCSFLRNVSYKLGNYTVPV